MAESEPKTGSHQSPQTEQSAAQKASAHVIYKESNLHSILRAKHSEYRDGIRGKFEQRLWTREPNILFQLTSKLMKGCEVSDYKPGFTQFLMDRYSSKPIDYGFKDRVQECVTQIENLNYHKFEPELITLYECKSKCLEASKASTFSRSGKMECFKVCHLAFNMKVRDRVEALTKLLEAGDIDGYEKF